MQGRNAGGGAAAVWTLAGDSWWQGVGRRRHGAGLVESNSAAGIAKPALTERVEHPLRDDTDAQLDMEINPPKASASRHCPASHPLS